MMTAKGCPMMLVLVLLFACWILSVKVDAAEKGDMEVGDVKIFVENESLLDRQKRWPLPEPGQRIKPGPKCRRVRLKKCTLWDWTRVKRGSGLLRRMGYNNVRFCRRFKWVSVSTCDVY
ncbi:uncharacterized protein LOC135479644 [Liolophura sinensis]|uniref:uncharacterized protein LOC135479644 n=1 Tax=Liolophura sinensis TaxID=3198878 RepID=UPI0031590485